MIRGEYCPGEHRLFLEGHGEGGPYGHDLICAAATILARSFAALAEDAQAAGLCRVEEKRLESGCCRVCCRAAEGRTHSLSLLLWGPVRGLQLLAEEYPEHLCFRVREGGAAERPAKKR